MNRFLIIIFSLITLITHNTTADNVQFTASARRVVNVGEQFSLTYTVNAKASRFEGPDFKNFDVLSGPNQSSSSSIQIINGSMSQSVTYTFSYVLEATHQGTFQIQPASVRVHRRLYKSNSVTIKVVKQGSNTQQNQTNRNYQQNRNYRQNQQNPVTNNINPGDIFIKAYVDKKNPMQGEQIIITYKLFTKLSISNITINNSSTIPGFWTRDLMKENAKLPQSQKIINGQKYITAVVKRMALFPLKSGKLKINPLKLDCIAQIRTQTHRRSSDPFFDNFFNDPFFNNSYRNVKESIKSNSVVINVKPLPLKDKPSDFSGAVGNFSFKSDIDKTKLKTNEALNLKYVITGKGNIDLIDKLNVTFPPDFDTYDPKITNNISTSVSGISGKRSFEYLVIPRTTGNYKIKPVKFTYFNINKHKYISLLSPEYNIKVEKGKKNQASVIYNSPGQEAIKYIGSDIRFIKTQPFNLQIIDSFFFGSRLFYLLLILPLSILILVIIIWKEQTKKRSNTLLMKNRKATKAARKRLKKANKYLKNNNKNEFYIEISQALWGYLSDKFSIPPAELSMDSVNEVLTKKNVKQELVKQVIDTLNDCEFKRFAPGDKSKNMDSIYNEALKIITKIERELR